MTRASGAWSASTRVDLRETLARGDPHDGKLDIEVVSAQSFGDLVRLTSRLLTRQYRTPPT